MVIGRAGENQSRIACILTDTGDASGQGGFGGVMGSKNLKAVAVRGTGSVNVARPKELTKITHDIQTLFSRRSVKGNPYEPEEKDFKYNIWGGGYGRGSLTLLPGELLDLCNDPSSGYSQIRMVVSPVLSVPFSCEGAGHHKWRGYVRSVLYVFGVHGPRTGKRIQQDHLAGGKTGRSAWDQCLRADGDHPLAFGLLPSEADHRGRNRAAARRGRLLEIYLHPFG